MAASEQRGFILHVVAGVTVSEREFLIELRRTALRIITTNAIMLQTRGFFTHACES